MNIFSRMRLRFFNYLRFGLVIVLSTAQAGDDFTINVSHLSVYDNQKIDTFTEAVLRVSKNHVKLTNEWVLAANEESVSLNANELYVDIFAGNHHWTLGKKKQVSGQSYFYNPSNFIALNDNTAYHYPYALRDVNQDGHYLLEYTRLLKSTSLSVSVFPKTEAIQFSMTKQMEQHNADIAINAFWDKQDHLKLGLNASMLVGDATLVYAEGAYATQVSFDNYPLRDNLYLITGTQYTTTAGYSINAEYYYHNKTLDENDIVASRGTLPVSALSSLASKGNLLFVNVRDVALTEHLTADFSFTKGINEPINQLSPTLDFQLNDNVDVYAKARFDLNNQSNHEWFLGAKIIF